MKWILGMPKSYNAQYGIYGFRGNYEMLDHIPVSYVISYIGYN